MDINEFIIKAKCIHGDKYDYSRILNFVYKNRVIILCPLHGEFNQFPNNHLRGSGCNKCARILIGKQKSSSYAFKEKASIVHNGKYNYCEANYINRKTKLNIICPIHNNFWQLPYAHLKGQGCPRCGNIKANNKKSDTNESFIIKAKTVHGDRYDYSQINYISSRKNIKIICPLHGQFLQRPSNHLNGYGCKKCNCNGGYCVEYFSKKNSLWFDRRFKYGYIYIKKFYSNTEEFYKIGISASKERNFKAKQYKIKHLYDIKCYIYDAYNLEQNILQRLKEKKKIYYPKFYFSGATECFKANEKLIKELKHTLDIAKFEMELYYSQKSLEDFRKIDS